MLPYDQTEETVPFSKHVLLPTWVPFTVRLDLLPYNLIQETVPFSNHVLLPTRMSFTVRLELDGDNRSACVARARLGQLHIMQGASFQLLYLQGVPEVKILALQSVWARLMVPHPMGTGIICCTATGSALLHADEPFRVYLWICAFRTRCTSRGRLSDLDEDGRLTAEEFSIAFHLVFCATQRKLNVPDELPPRYAVK